MDSPMSADSRSDLELLDAAQSGDERALAVLVERHRDRLERMVALRMDRRLQGRVDSADVVQEAYLAVRGKFAQYSADPRLPFFLWLRLEVLGGPEKFQSRPVNVRPASACQGIGSPS